MTIMYNNMAGCRRHKPIKLATGQFWILRKG